MISARNEHALSEVIGFILIIVIIITAFSLYLTYAVPAQGRENEIRHMDEVKDELVGYKIGVDSLWTNKQTESLMSTTIKMGTAGATTQGSNGFLPIIQPVGSSGTVAINQRTLSPEWLNISSYSYITNQSSKMNDTAIPITSTLFPRSYTNPPDNLFINITGLRNIVQTGNAYRAIFINGTDQQGIKWQAWINLTQRQTFYQWYSSVSVGGTTTCTAAMNTNGTAINVRWTGTNYLCLVPMNQYNYTGTDLTLSVLKNNTRTLSDFILYDSISASATPYVTDLTDPIYGLSSNIQKTSTIWYSEYDPNNDLAVNATAMYAYQFQPKYPYNISLGALEYRADNNYWIPQTYYYQMGGIFLSQSDGVSSKVPPSITFKYNPTGSIKINLLGISIGPENSGSIGGTSPIQIGTKILSNSGNLPYAPITNNTMNVTINFTSPTNDANTILMWKQYFQDAANRTGGIPDNNQFYQVGTTSNSAYIFVKGINDPTNPGSVPDNADINLIVQAVNLSVKIQSMSGV
jgi:hypothetical protein